MTLYGYRYKPGGMVFALRGYSLADAVAEAIQRRGQQLRNRNAATVELVEQNGEEWLAVPLPGDEDEAVAS